MKQVALREERELSRVHNNPLHLWSRTSAVSDWTVHDRSAGGQTVRCVEEAATAGAALASWLPYQPVEQQLSGPHLQLTP